MEHMGGSISWIGVVVGFVLSFLLGWAWYGPKLFGKTWAAGVGVELGTSKDMPIFAMVTQALGTFGLSWLFGITAAENALYTILLVMLTLILLVVSNGKYAQKSNAAVGIEAGYLVAMGVIMFICQGVF